MGNCPPGKVKIDGLCYNTCMPGYEHQPGMPYICTRSFTKNSFVIPPQAGVCLPQDENIAGLCYPKTLPSGYTRKVVGTLDQSCPAGADDGGVFCHRENYDRGVGKIPLEIVFKQRKAQEVDTPAPTCAEASALFPDPENPRLCQETICNPEDEMLQGDFCVAKCKPTYTDNGTQCDRAEGILDPVSGAPLPADSYEKRPPREIIWGVY